MPHFEASRCGDKAGAREVSTQASSRQHSCNSCSFVTLLAHRLSFSAAIKVKMHA
jgi:hypothetical protein